MVKGYICLKSLFSPFDKQFYPNLVDMNKGGMIFMCDIDRENGGKKLNNTILCWSCKNTKSGVPARPHEMKYPDGDCTSDIFIDMDNNDSSNIGDLFVLLFKHSIKLVSKN